MWFVSLNKEVTVFCSQVKRKLFIRADGKYECNSRQLCPWAICKANIFYFLINYARICQNEIILDKIAFLILTRYCSKASGNVHKLINVLFLINFFFRSGLIYCLIHESLDAVLLRTIFGFSICTQICSLNPFALF